MTMIARAVAFGRSMAADQAGSSSIRFALLVGLSASALLVVVRIGTAVAGTY